MRLKHPLRILFFVLILFFPLQMKTNGTENLETFPLGKTEVNSGETQIVFTTSLNTMNALSADSLIFLLKPSELPFPGNTGGSGSTSFLGPWKVMRKNLFWKWDWEEDFWVIYKEKGKVFIWDVQPSYRCEGNIKGNTLKCKWYADIGEFITTITFSKNGKSFTGKTEFVYWATGDRGVELLKGFRESSSASKEEREKTEQEKPQELSEPVEFEFSELSNEPSTVLKNGEWTGLPGALIFSHLNTTAKVQVVDKGEAAVLEGKMKIITPAAQVEIGGGKVKLEPYVGVIRPPTLSERLFGGFKFWYYYSVAPKLKQAKKDLKRGAKWIWKNKWELIKGHAYSRFITYTTGIPGFLLTFPTRFISSYFGRHYDDIVDGVKKFSEEYSIYLNQLNVDFRVLKIRSKVFVWLTEDDTLYVYLLKGEGELSDKKRGKTVKIPSAYYTWCREGGVPHEPRPFSMELLEKFMKFKWQSEGLIAYWHFDEGKGETTTDFPANRNNGRIYGARWTDGVSGSGLFFDGVNDYVEIPSSSSLNLNNFITIEVWINQDSPDASDRTIIAKGPSTTDMSNYDLRVLRGKIRFLFKDPTISWKVYSTINPVVKENSWTHIVVVHNWGKATSTRIYVNGVETAGAWIVGSGNESVVANSYPLYISGAGKLKGFNGIIDEVSIWNRALNAEEIKERYRLFAKTLTSPTSPEDRIKESDTVVLTGDINNLGSDEEKLTVEKPDSGQVFSIAGTWDTTFGQMIIKQSGNKITGTYTHDNGKIEGILNGNVLTGRWFESPSYSPPKDAGDFKFIFSKDFKSFTGNWKYGFGRKDWKGEWNGNRLK